MNAVYDVVILGAGYAGLMGALCLRRFLPRWPQPQKFGRKEHRTLRDNFQVLAFDEAIEAQLVKEGIVHWIISVGRSEKANSNKATRLLRSRRKRPRSRCTVEGIKKFPPLHVRPQGSEGASYRARQGSDRGYIHLRDCNMRC